MIYRIDNSSDGLRYYQERDDSGMVQWTYPSFTTKLSKVYPIDPYLMDYIRKEGEQGRAKFEKAGEEGTEVHIAIDRLIRGEAVDTTEMSQKVKRCISAFIAWAEEFRPKFMASETMLANHQLKVAGTRDCLAELNYTKGKTEYKGIYVIDWKTSSSLHEEHKVQVAGYWSCGDMTYKTALVHLGNKTKAGWSFSEFEPLPYYEQFKHFNKTFEMLYPDSMPITEEYPDLFKLDVSLLSPNII